MKARITIIVESDNPDIVDRVTNTVAFMANPVGSRQWKSDVKIEKEATGDATSNA